MIIDQNKLAEREFDDLVALIDAKCEAMRTRITQEVAGLRAEAKTKAMSPVKPKDKLLATAPPPDGTPRKSKVEDAFAQALTTPRRSAMRRDLTGSVSPSKRKVAFEAGSSSTPTTPTRKRPRLGTDALDRALAKDGAAAAVSNSVQGVSDTEETPRRRGRPKKQAAVEPVPDDVEISEDEEDVGRPRKFYPILLDARQWVQRDPRLPHYPARSGTTIIV
jgi:hypothetical protein